jgi:hypothetical protein
MCCMKFIRVLPGACVVRYCALSNVLLYYFEQTDSMGIFRSLKNQPPRMKIYGTSAAYEI